MRNFIRSISPEFLLKLYREKKKASHFKSLENQRDKGEAVSESQLIEDLKNVGIKSDDVLLVHSSLSKIGFVENGPKTVVDALFKVIGDNGHLLMPNSPNSGMQLEYIRELELFDVLKTPSKLGSISEYFRKLPNVVRSAHPTEPVSYAGNNSDYFVGEHFGELTPYTKKSPFYRVSEQEGKILYLGVTLDNAGTNLHTLEDSVDNFKYPVYFDEIFEVNVKLASGEIKKMNTRVHNPSQSNKRRCDELIPLFIERGVMKEVTIGNAKSLLVEAKPFLELMIDAYEKSGVTMYTPSGE